MTVGRFVGMMLAALVGMTATGCATTSMPGDVAARPASSVAVQVDPAQIYNDPLQGP